jgi:predicted nucleic acid-binding protein
LLAECTSVLSREVHSRRLDAATGRLLVERALRLPIRTVPRTEIYLRAYDIARSLGWAKAYDALYLAVADLEAAELLTLDGGMHKAAVRLSIRATLVGE